MLLFDGAFGTYIASKNLPIEFPEMANLEYPETVLQIHKEYLHAGANAVKTNSFAANRAYIEDERLVDQLLTRSYALACQAAAEFGAQVYADIGPVPMEEATEEYIRITELFAGLGASNFLFETQPEFRLLRPAIRRLRRTLPQAQIIVSFAVTQDGYTHSGEYYTDLFNEAIAAGANCVGLNCVCGPTHIYQLLKGAANSGYPLSAMPNAGYPSVVNGRTVYLDNPDYFASRLMDIRDLNVAVLGGCCGTTPRHIARIHELLSFSEPKTAVFSMPEEEKKTAAAVQTDFEKPFVAVELPAPMDTDTEFLLRAANMVRDAGGDYVTIPDSPLGKTRANSLMISAFLQQQAGIPAIAHLCCRDRNQIAIKGDLIGGNINGVSRILAITGDAAVQAARGEVKNVFGLNSFRLISYIGSLNEQLFAQKPFSICAALNINAANFDAELERAKTKIKNGAACLFTQPIFSQEHLARYRKAKSELPCRIAAGVLPLAGYKNALFLNNEVAGIDVPASVIEELRDKTSEQAKEICLAYARSIIDALGDDCDGYYLMTPLKKVDYTAELTKYIKEKIQ